MSEESTTTDLVELQKRLTAATNRGDVDAIVALYAADAVYDMSPVGMGVFEGQAAARGFIEDWWTSYEESEFEAEETLDLGNGVGFRVLVQKGRPVGSSGEVQLRYGTVSVWEDGKIARIANYTDIDEARAAAERLSEERGEAMSEENVEVVRRYYEHRQSHGDFLAELLAPDYVWDMSHFRGWAEQPTYEGIDGARLFIREWTAAFDDWAIEVEAIHDAGDDRVVGVLRQRGRSKSAGVPVDMRYAQVFTIRDGKQVRMEMYDDPDDALKAVGLDG
jgi:ketosteroid isomerase-like protein